MLTGIIYQYLSLFKQGFEDNHVYVCESRYSKKTKQFQKIKQYSSAVTLNPDTVISPRVVPLLPTRVPSAFAGKKLDSDGGESKSDKPATIVSLLPNKVSQVRLSNAIFRVVNMFHNCIQVLLFMTGWLRLT